VSRENVRLARTILEHWNAGDRDTALLAEYLDPTIRLESPIASVSGAAYEG
jgi:hypothetical protein